MKKDSDDIKAQDITEDSEQTANSSEFIHFLKIFTLRAS